MTLRAWKQQFAPKKTFREIAGESHVALATIFRAFKGARISQQNMKLIVKYTDGQVSYDDLVRGADRAESAGSRA